MIKVLFGVFSVLFGPYQALSVLLGVNSYPKKVYLNDEKHMILYYRYYYLPIGLHPNEIVVYILKSEVTC